MASPPMQPATSSRPERSSTAPDHGLLAPASAGATWAALAFARGAGALAMLLGCSLLATRVLDRPLPGAAVAPSVTMRAITAVSLAMTGAALWLVVGSRAARRWGRVLGALVAAIGLATLLEHLIGWSPGIEHLLFGDDASPAGLVTAGRMAPAAALCFTLLGLSLVLLDRPCRGRYAFRYVPLLPAMIALVPTVGFAFSPDRSHPLPRLTGISWSSALCLLLLACGALAARPDNAVVRVLGAANAGGAVARRLLLPAAVIPLTLVLCQELGHRAGWFATEVSRAVLAATLIIVLVAVVFYTAFRLSCAAESRARAESERRESEQRFRTVFEQATNGIVLSRGGRWVDVNPAMCAFLQRPREELVGTRGEDHVPRSHREELRRAQEVLFRTGQWRGELPLQRSDGSLIHLMWNSVTEVLPHTQLGIATDVSEPRRVLDERERLLSSERAARADAEQAARLKDEFLATVSHELRTPLNAIFGWAQYLQRGKHDADTIEQAADVIERASRAQAQLIDDLLDMSRIVSGKLRLDVQTMALVPVIDAALQTVQPGIEAKGLRVEQRLDRRAGPVRGDPTRLQQVVWNLLANAVKFTPRGGTISIVLQRIDDDAAELRVSDTGDGIKPEFLPHLFERFRQADSSTRRQHGGLGLGLAIVKHIVELHGGQVSASSGGEKRGATFTVRLPIEIARVAGGPRTGGSIAAEVRLSGVRILIVDDDPAACEVMQRVLCDCEAQVEVVTSGEEALARTRSCTPHVLVCDIGMPGMDGYDVIQRMRSAGVNTPAIAVTAFARAEDRIRALQAGYDMHLAKPVDTQELLTVVGSLVRTAVTSGSQAPRRA